MDRSNLPPEICPSQVRPYIKQEGGPERIKDGELTTVPLLTWGTRTWGTAAPQDRPISLWAVPRRTRRQVTRAEP